MNRSSLLLLLCLAIAGLGGCRGGKQDGDATQPASGQSRSAAESEGSGGDRKDGSVPANTVRIAREDQGRAGIRVAAVIARTMPTLLTVTGQVAMDEKHTERIGALADGRIESVYVLPGDSVHRGQTLATLHSHMVHETVAALTQAFAAAGRQQSALKFADQANDRYARLYAIQAASLEEKQRAEQEVAQQQKGLTDAEANVRAEREHLAELLQVAPESLQPGTLYNKELIPVRAVADGVVISRNVTPGQVVNTGDETFVTSNLSTVWVNAAVNEKDLSAIHLGASATVTTQGVTGEGLRGKVTMLGDVVDPQTRTLPVRLSIPNPRIQLRPGMFATVSVDEPGKRSAVFVPSGALQDVNGFRVVFVTPEGTHFEARAVKTGPETKGLVEITEGLAATDHVVIEGAFMVKGELLKGTVGED